jgi:hypothetical protein
MHASTLILAAVLAAGEPWLPAPGAFINLTSARPTPTPAPETHCHVVQWTDNPLGTAQAPVWQIVAHCDTPPVAPFYVNTVLPSMRCYVLSYGPNAALSGDIGFTTKSCR